MKNLRSKRRFTRTVHR